MAAFEFELFRYVPFQRVGGHGFNTSIIPMQSGQEQRNSNWVGTRAEYTLDLITPAIQPSLRQFYVDQLRAFHLLVGGTRDPFRYFDPIDCLAEDETLGTSDAQGTTLPATQRQLQKTYSLGGRTFIRPISKPITAAVMWFDSETLEEANMANTVFLDNSPDSIDHATGIVTFGSDPGTVTGSFSYHIPVRFTTDKFQPKVEPSAVKDGKPIITWPSFGLMEVLPPNY